MIDEANRPRQPEGAKPKRWGQVIWVALLGLIFIGVPVFMAINDSSAGAITRLLCSTGAYLLNIAVQLQKADPSDSRTRALAHLEVLGSALLAAGGGWMVITYSGLAGALIGAISGLLIICGIIKQTSRR